MRDRFATVPKSVNPLYTFAAGFMRAIRASLEKYLKKAGILSIERLAQNDGISDAKSLIHLFVVGRVQLLNC
jgi:hypothetical protein